MNPGKPYERGPAIAKRQHFDAGLEYLKSIQEPGQRFSQKEVAKACGITHQAMQQREKKILAKLSRNFPELKEYL